MCVCEFISILYISSFQYKERSTHNCQNQITSSTLHISRKSKVQVLKHLPWCIVAAPPLPFARENMTVKRCCPKGINWWCWHTWSTNIKLWLRAEMATNSRSNTIVEQLSATNQCLRTAPILRRILGGSLPCDIWRCFQQIAFLKARPNDQLVLHILYSCFISMAHRLTNVHRQISSSVYFFLYAAKSTQTVHRWSLLARHLVSCHATGWSNF